MPPIIRIPARFRLRFAHLSKLKSADREQTNAILFDEYILKDNANFRVPYSIHPKTGLVAMPLARSDLPTFRPEQAQPETVAGRTAAFELPRYRLRDVDSALRDWHEDGC